MNRSAPVLSLVLSVLLLPSALAQTRYVDPAGADVGDCTSAGAPCRSISYALSQAAAGDVILLGAGVYTEDGGVAVMKSVTIRGAGSEQTYVQEAEMLEGADARVFLIASGAEVRLEMLAVRHGKGGMGEDGGGGIRNEGVLELFQVTVRGNTTSEGMGNEAGGFGGGIFNAVGAGLMLEETTVQDNGTRGNDDIESETLELGVASGGGIYNAGALTMHNSAILNNRAGSGYVFGGDGGGLYNASGGSATLEASTIVNNRAGGYFFSGGSGRGSGGGVYNARGAEMLLLEDSGVSFNVAPRGCGGIRNLGKMLVENSAISENLAGDEEDEFFDFPAWGGGVCNDGELTARRSSITGNRTVIPYEIHRGEAGGLFARSTEAVTILEETVVSGNEARDGGGILNGGMMTLESSTVADNTASSSSYDIGSGGNNGGGVLNSGTLTVRRSTISGNTVRGNKRSYVVSESAGRGGGLFNSGQATLVNSTVSDNFAEASASYRDEDLALEGGKAGIFNSGSLRLVHSTVTGNRAEGSGYLETEVPGTGGLHNAGRSAAAVLVNTILAQNQVVGGPLEWSDCFTEEGKLTSRGHNLVGINSGCEEAFSAGQPNAHGDLVGTREVPLISLLGPLADNGGPTLTHALLEGSPAIDAGTCLDLDGDPVPQDQRGYPRQAPCDIGAFELQQQVADATAPVCGPIEVEKNASGQLTAVSTSATDAESGIASVTFTRLRNLQGFLSGAGPFSEGHTQAFDPALTPTVTIRGERIDMSAGGAMVTRITNGAGLEAQCDPVLSTLSAEVPEAFSLEQNYPNPFQTTTEVAFSLPEPAHVKLLVFDLLGREVARLVDEELAAGRYAARWEAGEVPSGVYVVRLEAVPFIEARSVTLIK